MKKKLLLPIRTVATTSPHFPSNLLSYHSLAKKKKNLYHERKLLVLLTSEKVFPPPPASLIFNSLLLVTRGKITPHFSSHSSPLSSLFSKQHFTDIVKRLFIFDETPSHQYYNVHVTTCGNV
jgi:hypothetical protein